MRKFLFGILFVFIFCFILPQTVFASRLFFDAESKQVRIGDKIELNLFIDTEQESINAFEGKIIFPKDILDLEEMIYDNTIVNFWIEKPKDNNGSIAFSGVTPGGFNSEKGLILSVVFEPVKEGVARFEIKETRVLRNDGIGSAAILAVIPFEAVVSKAAPAEISEFPEKKDREPPESFAPEIAKDEAFFNEKWFAVFTTQDKSSGIDYYEIKESRQMIPAVFKKWVRAESPHVLSDQELRSYVLIKAVDRAGNAKVIRMAPRNPLPFYANYENYIIIMAGIFIIALGLRKLCQVVKIRLPGGKQ